jgi:NCAIR mutase (PurE)-related protein
MATLGELERFGNGFKGLGNQRSLLAIKRVARIAHLDVGREIRKGLPEIILAEGKAPQEVAEIVEAMVKSTGRAIVSRAGRKYIRPIFSKRIPKSSIQFFERSGIIVVKQQSYRVKETGGRVGLLTAGTSDIPVAEEAKVIAEEMGCKTRVYYDVGVAGLHRLFKPLSDLLRWNADVILVVAGREGALPTVVAGLVDVPVIGVPTSRSYGFGDKGIAALAAMLQSCSLGIAVVNIDGGVGAGSIGGVIANRAARYRQGQLRG